MGSDSANSSLPSFLRRTDGVGIAYHLVSGRSPTVVFLGGFASDMTGTKATHLDAYCRARAQAYLRLDYRGHGASSGRLVDGTIGAWRDDALAVIGERTEGPLILVGSSMGAWLMLLVAMQITERIDALVGIASAPDFTHELVWQRLPEHGREQLLREGVLHVPSEYQADGMPISLGLIEEGRRHLLLEGEIPLDCPVRLLHGLADEDVPWELSRRLSAALTSREVTLELIKGGDHRLSSTSDLSRLTRTLTELLDR